MKLLHTVTTITFLVFLLTINLLPQDSETISDESETIKYGIENDLVSRYIWRGLSYNHGLIHQPTLWVSYNNFTFYSWANLTQHDVDKNEINNEIDITVQYSKQVDEIYSETALTYIYFLRDDVPATIEASIKLSYEIFDTELYSDVTLDVMEYSGSLSGSVGINKVILENDEFSITTGLSTGWANKKFNYNYVGDFENPYLFNFLNIAIGANYYITENFYIKPHIEYCYLFSPLFKSTSGNSLTNFGIAVGVEF